MKKTIITLSAVNLLYLGAVALISLLSIFLYPAFARWMGAPFDAILKLNPWLVRAMMTAGFLIYGAGSLGCILMMRMKKRGFWWFAIPAFLIISASLFVVFSPVNLVQLLLLIVSVIWLAVLTKHMH